MRVLVVAAGTIAQAGLAALVEPLEGVTVAGAVSPEGVDSASRQVEPDVCLVDAEGRGSPDVVADVVDAATCPVIVMGEPEEFRAFVAAGAAGALVPSVPAATLVTALEAVAAGLAVFYPVPALEPDASAGLQPRPPEAPLVERLTAREIDVLRLLADGLTNQQLARRLGISEHTAKFHVSQVLGKLGAQSRAEAVTLGYRHGLIVI